MAEGVLVADFVDVPAVMEPVREPSACDIEEETVLVCDRPPWLTVADQDCESVLVGFSESETVRDSVCRLEGVAVSELVADWLNVAHVVLFDTDVSLKGSEAV
jgi:hypothetical protein